MNQCTHRVVMALATFALAIATGSAGIILTAKAAEAISSSSVLVEQQAAGVRFSVQDESTVALRLEVLSLDGRIIFQSEWQPDKTVVWSAALITRHTVANGVYLYAISVRDRERREQRKLGKLVLVQGLEPRLSIPAVSELVTTEPAAAQFPLTAGTSWSQRLGGDRSDTYRILRRPARLPGGPPTSFEQLLQLGADGKLRITALCLGTAFAPVTTQNPDNLSSEGDCRSSWSGVTGGGTSNGWTDDGAIVRLATAADKVGIGTTTPAQALEVNGITSLGAPGGIYGYLFGAYPTLGFNTYGAPFYLAGIAGYGGILQFSDANGSLIYYTGSTVAAGAAHVNTPRFTIDKDGNVGVGTTTPTVKLSVQTGTGFYGFIHTDGDIAVGSYVGGSASGAVGGWLGTKSNHQLHFFTNNGQPSMTIDTNGNVGIGTTSPCRRLHVFEGSSGRSCFNSAIVGEGNNVIGVTGVSSNQQGVFGESTSSVGVLGRSDSYTAVAGASRSGTYIFAGYDSSFQTPAARFVVERATGNVKATGAFTGGGVDYADMLPVAGNASDYEPGDVLVIGPDSKLTKSSQPYSTALAGVYSTQPAFVGDPRGLTEDSQATKEELVPVALVGLVPVKVSAENGSIHPGDLLTTSSLPGYAMKAKPVMINGMTLYPTGTIIGKALESLESGKGIIEVLVTLR